jgi:hypothetical protein
MLTRILLFAALALPAPALAFCGFFVSGADAELYNDATQVVLMRKDQRTVMTISNNYRGPTEDFAMVVPVPTVLQESQVKTLSRDIFKKIDALSAPRLVEYWEQDPCYVPRPVKRRSMKSGRARPSMARAPGAPSDLGVTIEAQFQVGEYKIVILSADDSGGLDTWLRRENYNIPKGAGEALAPYVKSGMKFFVAKVDIKKVFRDANDTVVLSPLRFDYDSPDLRLPVRLGLLNAKGAQDLLIYLLHPKSRFEAANYKNVFIPSNLEVLDEVRKSFGAFYVQLFDQTLAKAGGKAIVTEYAWQTSSCDPCPVPPLTPADIYTLGGDVFGTGGGGAIRQPRRPQRKGRRARRPDRSRPYFGPSSNWVLTRLHTRYSKETLSEDIVFRPAPPVVGGRGSAGRSTEAPGEAKRAGTNNFQGRYIIRHYWEGKVSCESPNWGRWGGPPTGGKQLKMASDLANAPRGTVKLKRVVTSKLDALDLPGQPTPKRKNR